MPWRVEFKASAGKALTKLDRATQEAVQAAIDRLLEDLDTWGRARISDVKKLKGVEETVRLRVGRMRVIYQMDGDRLVVLVLELGHRRDIYR